jgi:hypothetical protein
MTDRRFTPPIEFPAEYVTGDGKKAVIVGARPSDGLTAQFIGYTFEVDGTYPLNVWHSSGSYWSTEGDHRDLHDTPKKQVRWVNDYYNSPSRPGRWYETRKDADEAALATRIAVIRREWVEGQPPQYFMEEV